jgi:type IV secretory pathway TraG/TraD family ATPase VirD4
VLSSLHRVADALRLLPTEKDSKTRWSTAEWSKKPMGWVFLPSTNSTRECLMPLVSLWLDLLVMRFVDERVGLDIGSLRPTWFVLDEVALLQNLLKLHDAIARNLNASNPVVLGMQRRNQWQKHHGLDAEAMLSQSGAKIFLRTSEPETAKWISDTIGKVEIEQLRESRWQEPWRRSRRSKNYQLERRIEPLVLASQITGLEDRRGYLKSGNAVVQLSFSYVDLPKVQPALIARVPEVSPEEPPKTAAAVAGVNDSPGSDDVREAPAVAEQRTNQNRQLEHTALPAKRRFFE